MWVGEGMSFLEMASYLEVVRDDFTCTSVFSCQATKHVSNPPATPVTKQLNSWAGKKQELGLPVREVKAQLGRIMGKGYQDRDDKQEHSFHRD